MLCKPTKTVCLALVLCLTATATMAQFHEYQQHLGIRQLDIGDTVPPIVLDHFLHSPEKKQPISELYRNGMLIINFWATWCGSCLTEMPLLNDLARKYHQKLRVLSVAYQDENVVSAFLAKRKDIPVDNLDIISNDTLLVEYFKHLMLPHNIWIDSLGIVRNITGRTDISEGNIDTFLKRGRLTKAVYKKDVLDFDWGLTFHLRDSSFSYRSFLSSYTPSIPGGSTFYITKYSTESWEINRFFAFNESLEQTIWAAYCLERRWSLKDDYNRMQIFTKDSSKFYWPKQCPNSYRQRNFPSEDEWRNKNLYCYELILPHGIKSPMITAYIFQDLMRNFQISIKKESKKILCTILTKSENRSFKKFTPSVRDSSFIRLSENGLVAQKVTLLTLMEWLNIWLKDDINDKALDAPYIDKTSINYPIDLKIEFPSQPKSFALFKLIRKELQDKYGLEFHKLLHNYSVLVVKDLN